MLPPNSPSSTSARGAYLAPDDVDRALLQDFELGGAELEDTTQGLAYRTWKIWLDEPTKDVKLAQVTGGPATVTTLFNSAQLTELTFTFDQSMRPTVSYMEAGVCKLRWYDPIPAAIVTDVYPGAYSPFLALDERRPLLLSNSDMLFFYIRDGRVRYRRQRDRFEVEYPYGPTLPAGKSRIMNVGVTDKLRFQVTVRTEQS